MSRTLRGNLMVSSESVGDTLRRTLILLGLPVRRADEVARRTAPSMDDSMPDIVFRDAIRSVRGEVQGDFGLTADQRLARVLAMASPLGAAKTAEIMEVTPASLEELLTGARLAGSNGTNRRVVVLEDDWVFRKHLEDCCSSCEGLLVASTRDPVLVVMAAQAYQPGLAIIDLNIDGNDVAGDLAAMKIHEVAPACEVMFVTAYEHADQIASQIPNATALVKPVKASQITSAIQKALT